jgi:hypothetical protein
VAQHEDRNRIFSRQMRLDKGRNVSDDAGRRTGETVLMDAGDGAAPSTLVEALDGDATVGEGGHHAVVAVYVIAKAVDEE